MRVSLLAESECWLCTEISYYSAAAATACRMWHSAATCSRHLTVSYNASDASGGAERRHHILGNFISSPAYGACVPKQGTSGRDRAVPCRRYVNVDVKVHYTYVFRWK